MFVRHRKNFTSPLRAQQVNEISRFVKIVCQYNVTITVLDIINRPAFYLKDMVENVRTSQETHYVNATSPTG
jgi:hypothetical protein